MSDLRHVPRHIRPELDARVQAKRQRMAETLITGGCDLGDEPACHAYLRQHGADLPSDHTKHFEAALDLARALQQGEQAA